MQADGTVKLEDRASALLLEGLPYFKDGKIIVKYEPEKSGSVNEPVTKEEEKDAKHANIEFPYVEIFKQRTISHQIEDWIWHLHAAQELEIMICSSRRCSYNLFQKQPNCLLESRA